MHTSRSRRFGEDHPMHSSAPRLHWCSWSVLQISSTWRDSRRFLDRGLTWTNVHPRQVFWMTKIAYWTLRPNWSSRKHLGTVHLRHFPITNAKESSRLAQCAGYCGIMEPPWLAGHKSVFDPKENGVPMINMALDGRLTNIRYADGCLVTMWSMMPDVYKILRTLKPGSSFPDWKME